MLAYYICKPIIYLVLHFGPFGLYLYYIDVWFNEKWRQGKKFKNSLLHDIIEPDPFLTISSIAAKFIFFFWRKSPSLLVSLLSSLHPVFMAVDNNTPTNNSSVASSEKPYGISNTKAFIPLILDLDKLNYDAWRDLFETHCNGFDVSYHFEEHDENISNIFWKNWMGSYQFHYGNADVQNDLLISDDSKEEGDNLENVAKSRRSVSRQQRFYSHPVSVGFYSKSVF